VAAVVMLTSLSECKDFLDGRTYAPASAVINGIKYSSDYHSYIGPSEYARYGIRSGDYCFGFLRHLYSEKGEEVALSYNFSADTIVCNKKYDINHVILWIDWDENRYYSIDGADGQLEFTKIDTIQRQIAGRFELSFTIVDDTEQVINIKNGMFDVPYKSW